MKEIKPVRAPSPIELIDRVSMLDNDLIRLRTKVKTLKDAKKRQKD